MPHADIEQRQKYQQRYRPEWQRANREKLRGYATKYRKKYPEKMLWIAARVRAKKRGIEFSIDISDIVIPTECPVLGIPIVLKEVTRQKNALPNSPSLDRIRPDRGYVKGNVQVISWRANNIKRDATPDELRRVADFVTAQWDK